MNLDGHYLLNYNSSTYRPIDKNISNPPIRPQRDSNNVQFFSGDEREPFYTIPDESLENVLLNQHLMITKEGKVKLDKDVIAEQKGPTCWIHSILNSLLLSDDMRRIIAGKLFEYMNKRDDYLSSNIESFLDGDMSSIPMTPPTAHFKFVRFMIFKYIYIYLYYSTGLNRTAAISPYNVIREKYILDKSLHNLDYPSLLAHVLNPESGVCARLIQKALPLEGKNSYWMLLEVLKFIDKPFYNLQSWFDKPTFVRSNEFIIFSRGLYAMNTMTQWGDIPLNVNITGNRYIIESASCIIKKCITVGNHVLSFYKKDDNYFIVDSLLPTNIIPCKWYLQKERDASITNYIHTYYNRSYINKEACQITIQYTIYVKENASIMSEELLKDKLQEINNEQVKMREMLWHQNLGGMRPKLKYKYKNRSYTVRYGKRGGTYIIVGADKTKIYIKP